MTLFFAMLLRRFFAASPWGTVKTGAFRAKFLLEAVADLKQRLKGIGSDLIVAVGAPEEVLPRYAAPAGADTLVLTQASH